MEDELLHTSEKQKEIAVKKKHKSRLNKTEHFEKLSFSHLVSHLGFSSL